jgi:gamma-tubulin complex component 5
MHQLTLHQTAGMHRTILNVLDMCVYFSDCFATFAGDATLDISRQSLRGARHRSRRLRRQSRNVVSLGPLPADAASESSSEDEADIDAPAPSFSGAASTTFTFGEDQQEDVAARLDRMAVELDEHVRFVRRAAEALASGGSDLAPACGMLAFTLEDWDR